MFKKEKCYINCVYENRYYIIYVPIKQIIKRNLLHKKYEKYEKNFGAFLRHKSHIGFLLTFRILQIVSQNHFVKIGISLHKNPQKNEGVCNVFFSINIYI